MSEQLYMEPQAYFDYNDKQMAANRSELDRLRSAVKDADAVAAKATDWTERTRAEGHAKSLARELQSAEVNAKQAQGGASQQAQQRGEGQPGYVLSDCGTAYLFVENTKKRKPPAPRAAAVAVSEQMYAEPLPPGE